MWFTTNHTHAHAHTPTHTQTHTSERQLEVVPYEHVHPSSPFLDPISGRPKKSTGGCEQNKVIQQ